MSEGNSKNPVFIDDSEDLFDIINSTSNHPNSVTEKNSKNFQSPSLIESKKNISLALSEKYSNDQVIDISENIGIQTKLDFKSKFSQPSKSAFPITATSIISMPIVPKISLTQSTYKSHLEAFSEKHTKSFSFSRNKFDREKDEIKAFKSLKNWIGTVDPEKKIPVKRSHEEADLSEKLLKKPKDIKTANKEFLKQNNHEAFSIESFLKEQQKQQKKEQDAENERIKNLEKKNKEEKEYREKMKHSNYQPLPISEEDLLLIEYNKRQKLQFSLSEFYGFLLGLDPYNIQMGRNTAEIPTSFKHGGEYIDYFMPAFFEEAKGEIFSALSQNDMSDFSVISLVVHSNKNDNLGILDIRDESGGNFRFSYRVQSEDILLIVLGDTSQQNFCKSFKDWHEKPQAIIGLVEREKNINRVLIREEYLSLFENEIRVNVFILDTATTMIREFKMIRSAEFLELNEQILNPKHRLKECQVHELESFISAIEVFHNPSQIDAVIKSSRIMQGIFLLQGPPGTGKTHTIKGILSAIFQKIRDPYILVCAPSNSAIDELANRIALNGLYDCDGHSKKFENILRVGNNFKKSSHDIREKIKKDLRETPKAVEEISLSFKVAELFKNKGTESGNIEIDKLMQDLDNVDKLLVLSRKKEKKAEIISLEEKRSKIQSALFKMKQMNKTATQKRKECEVGLLNTSNIIFTTLSSAGSKEMMQINHGFDYVIIDEACQSVELSSLIPLQFKAKVVVLVGDPKQLPSTTLNRYSNENQYSRSLFERLMKGGSKVYMLTYQYRMIPEISEFPSMYFYSNRLENSESVMCAPIPLWIKNRGILFINLQTSRESKNCAETSLSNTPEAEFIGQLYSFYKFLHGSKLNIGVITPYRRQVVIIKEYLQKFYENEWKIDVEVNTIDGFQGREKDVIVFSTVRSEENIGFLSDVRRMNVAITRAKFGLWIVGKLECLQRNNDWAEFILHCRNCDKVINCANFQEIKNRFEPDPQVYKNFNQPAPNKIHVKRENTPKKIEAIKRDNEIEKKIQENKKEQGKILALDIISRTK